MKQQQEQAAVKLLQHQAGLTRRARRLHVTNLPPGIQKEHLQELFNRVMTAANLANAPCVNAIQMPDNKFAEGSTTKFAFIEFRSVFEASAAVRRRSWGRVRRGRALAPRAAPSRSSRPPSPPSVRTHPSYVAAGRAARARQHGRAGQPAEGDETAGLRAGRARTQRHHHPRAHRRDRQAQLVAPRRHAAQWARRRSEQWTEWRAAAVGGAVWRTGRAVWAEKRRLEACGGAGVHTPRSRA